MFWGTACACAALTSRSLFGGANLGGWFGLAEMGCDGGRDWSTGKWLETAIELAWWVELNDCTACGTKSVHELGEGPTAQNADSSASLVCDSTQSKSSSSSNSKDSAALNNCCVQRVSRSSESAILYT